MAFISGLFTFISMLAYINPVTGWLSFALFFMTIYDKSSIICFRAGLIFGLAISIPAFFWMIEGAQRFTGGDSIYGYLVFIISSFIWILYFGAVNYCFSILRIKNDYSFSGIVNALIIACVYVSRDAFTKNPFVV